MMIDVPVEGNRWKRTEYELSSWPGLLKVLAQNMQIGNEGALKFLRGYLKTKKTIRSGNLHTAMHISKDFLCGLSFSRLCLSIWLERPSAPFKNFLVFTCYRNAFFDEIPAAK